MLDSWYYFDNNINSLKEIGKLHGINENNLYGFVYKLELMDNNTKDVMYYIGKKNFFNLKKSLSLKSKLPRKGHVQFIRKNKDKNSKDGHRVEYEIYKVESDWLTYTGSYVEKDNYKVVSKIILDIALTKAYLTYLEAYYLFKERAIESAKYINSNILGKFYRGRINEDEKIDYSKQDLAKDGVYFE